MCPTTKQTQSTKQFTDDELLEFLGVDRHIEDIPEAHMVCKKMCNGANRIKPGMVYKFTFYNNTTELIEVGPVGSLSPEDAEGLKRSEAKRAAVKPVTPEHTVVEVEWKANVHQETADGSNVLGDNSAGLMHHTKGIKIGTNEGTREALAYYGAQLLEHGDYIEFEFPEGWELDFPLFTMDTGHNYFRHYQEETGHYIEEHNLPHYHCPMTSANGGFYMLGKFVGEQTTPAQSGMKEIEVSGFTIPFGTAVYTPLWTLHNDGGLYGEIAAGYYAASEYTTCIFVQEEDGEHVMTPMEFVGKVAERDAAERMARIRDSFVAQSTLKLAMSG